MKKFEGIVVVAFRAGAPISELEAALEINGYDLFDFRTIVRNKLTDDIGFACKVNLIDEALDLKSDLVEAGLHSDIVESGDSKGWVV